MSLHTDFQCDGYLSILLRGLPTDMPPIWIKLLCCTIYSKETVNENVCFQFLALGTLQYQWLVFYFQILALSFANINQDEDF